MGGGGGLSTPDVTRPYNGLFHQPLELKEWQEMMIGDSWLTMNRDKHGLQQ